MLDHPQDAYQLAKERQCELRQSVKKVKIIKISVFSKGEKLTVRLKDWGKILFNLRKVRFEIILLLKDSDRTLIVQKS